MATTTNSASISTINVSTPNHISNASSTPCSIQASCLEDEDREPNDQAQEWVIGVMLTLCAVGIIINCIGLFVLYLSFAFKSGSVFLEMLGVFDIMTCTMVIPFEVYGILKIETVNVPGGACIMLSILDSWICFSTLISVLAASIYILGRCTHHELPDVKRKNWSHSVGAIMLLSLLLAAIMWMARPNGIKFYKRSKNIAKSALARMSCIFREGALLETAGIAATTIVSIRLGVLVFIAVTMGAAFVAFYRQQKRQKGEISSEKTAPGLDEVDLSHRPSYMCQPINYGRLMDAVSTVVYEGVPNRDLEESTAIVEWVADTMSEDQKLIDAVIQCYFYGEWRDHSSKKPSTHQVDPLPDVSSTGGPALLKPLPMSTGGPALLKPSPMSTGGPALLNPPPMSTGGPALLNPPPRSTGCLALLKPPMTTGCSSLFKSPPMTTGCSSLLKSPPTTTGCSSLLNPPQTMIAPEPDQHRDSITDPVGPSEMSSRSNPAGTSRRFLTFDEQAKHADDHDSDRRARPGLDTEEDPVDLHGIRSSMDMHVHSALTYMYVTGEQQVAVRREMIYQRALNRLMRSGYSVNSAAVSSLTLNNPRAAARYYSACLYACLCL